MTRAAVLVTFALVAAAPAPAQLPAAIGAGPSAASLRLRVGDSTAAQVITGMAVGGRLRLGSRAAGIEASYLEGTLEPDTGTTAGRDLVDGSILLFVSPARWLTLRAGPHVRAWVFGGGTQRWIWWEGHARLDGALVGERLRAHVAMWSAITSDVNVPAGAGAARGGEAGLTARLAATPVWIRLTYAIDRTTFSAGGAEMLEALRLSVLFGGR